MMINLSVLAGVLIAGVFVWLGVAQDDANYLAKAGGIVAIACSIGAILTLSLERREKRSVEKAKSWLRFAPNAETKSRDLETRIEQTREARAVSLLVFGLIGNGLQAFSADILALIRLFA